MKFIYLALILTLSLGSFASGTKKKGTGEMFQKAKERQLKYLQQRMDNLSTKKSCISSATDRSAMKECNRQAKEMHSKFKQSRKAEKETFVQEMKRRRAERKAKKAAKQAAKAK